MIPAFQASLTRGAQANGDRAGGVTLQTPPGPAGAYRLAQLDNYHGLARRAFPHQPPLTISLRARLNTTDIPGTWGFGLWNDPFGMKLGFGGGQKLPCLPNACWFFGASAQNHLSFRSRQPANGFLAQTFRTAPLPSLLLAPGALALPLLAFRPAARLLRTLASRLIREQAYPLTHDAAAWHDYAIEWRAHGVTFRVDGAAVFESAVSPRAPLGIVIWLDNQYAAWHPDGRVGWGTLASDATAWLEIQNVCIS